MTTQEAQHETLTNDEAGELRVLVRCPGWGTKREVDAVAKALRVIDARDARIAELEADIKTTEKTLREDYRRAAESLLALRDRVETALRETPFPCEAQRLATAVEEALRG